MQSSSKWRVMTLREVYPYWVLGEAPPGDIPHCACNDMLAGHMDDEVVAIAALSEPSARDLDRLLPRALARLGVTPMSREEVARSQARERMRDLAREIVAGKEERRHGTSDLRHWAILICRYALLAGALDANSDAEKRLTDTAAAFHRMVGALEARKDNSIHKRQVEDLIIEAAETLLAGLRSPTWYVETSGELRRGAPSSGSGAAPDGGERLSR